jgi:hypothetical protein
MATVGPLPSIISVVVKIRFVRAGCLGAKTPLYIIVALTLVGAAARSDPDPRM